MRQAAKKTRRFPLQERSKRTVEAILEGAARVLSERGYMAASTNLIAERAGVSIGSLYQFFPDKESVISALVEETYREDARAIKTTFEKYGQRGFEKLILAVLKTLLERFSEKKKLRRAIYHEVPRSGPEQTVKTIKFFLIDYFAEYLTERADYKVDRGLDLKLFILVNSIEATLYEAVFESRSKFDERALLQELKNLVILYLRGGFVTAH